MVNWATGRRQESARRKSSCNVPTTATQWHMPCPVIQPDDRIPKDPLHTKTIPQQASLLHILISFDELSSKHGGYRKFREVQDQQRYTVEFRNMCGYIKVFLIGLVRIANEGLHLICQIRNPNRLDLLYLYRCTVRFAESLDQHPNQCTHIKLFILKLLKVRLAHS